MSRKIHHEDFSLDHYALVGGLDELHEILMKQSFIKVVNMGSYLRIYNGSIYVGTGKIVKINNEYVPMVFIFNIGRGCYAFDRNSDVLPYGGLIHVKYPTLRVYNKRMIHPKGRIYGFAKLKHMTQEAVKEWKEIYAEMQNEDDWKPIIAQEHEQEYKEVI